MPTKQEMADLSEKCDWTWTTMKGVDGYIVRGRGSYASASIFLPATGYGYYWSSVPGSDSSYGAWGLYFYSGGHDTGYGSRYSGQPVRPVQGLTK